MHPDGPDLFLDRSLGRTKVSERLRQHGRRLVTLAEHYGYGMPADQDVADTDWRKLCGQEGWRPSGATRLIEYVQPQGSLFG